MADLPDKMNVTTSTGASLDSLDLPPLPSVDTAGDLAAALGEHRLRALMLGERMPALRVGRYALERQLGSGGMGSVWRAWDEQLRRPVALKFLHRGHETESGRRRFEREAQGLAQLSHPNVVGVYDVGRYDDRVWIAMEFVPGRTLRVWQAEAQPSARELLAVWVAAGRGLAAVHAAGLLHRDIKPDNIMMGDDGRVRLVDFGLVRQTDDDALQSTIGSSARPGETSTGGVEGSQTELGTFVGTPAYAAPEQLEGLRVDARADQYAFCVGLWEALTGERPSKTERAEENLALPEGARMPVRVRRALERGLAPDPDRRFANMEALLDAIGPRRRAWLAPTLAAVLAGAVGVGVAVAGSPDAVDPCAGADEAITRAWTSVQRDALGDAYTAREATHIAGIIDEWTGAWGETATRTCEAHARGEFDSEARYEGQQHCLAGARSELERLLRAIEARELDEAAVALAWLGELPDPTTCATGGGELSDAPPQALLDAIRSVETQASRVRHNLDSETLGARLERSVALHDQAVALAWTPLILTTAVLAGNLAVETGDATVARTHFGLAHDLGLRHRDTRKLAYTAGGMANIELRLELDAEAGAWWIAREAAAVEAEGSPPASRAHLALHRGRLSELRGDLDSAERDYAEAVAGFRAAGARFEYLLALALRVHGNLLVVRGREHEATAKLDEARALEAAGAPPPMVAESVDYNAGVNALAAGDPALAADIFKAVLAAASTNHGPRSMLALQAHIGLSGANDALGRIDDALAHAEQADALAQAIVGPTHPVRGEALSALGAAQYRQRRFAAAVATFERALTIAIEHTPADSLDRGLALLNLGDALYELGSDDLRAQTVLERAQAILVREIGPSHPNMAVVLKPLAGLALRAGRLDEARTTIDAAVAIVDSQPRGEVEAAEIRWLCAQIDARAGDPARARAQAERAAAAFAAMGDPWQTRTHEIHRWLDSLPATSNTSEAASD